MIFEEKQRTFFELEKNRSKKYVFENFENFQISKKYVFSKKVCENNLNSKNVGEIFRNFQESSE